MPDQVAGTEMYCYALQNALQKIGYSGGVIIPGFGKTQRTEYDFEGIRVICYPQAKASEKEIKGILAPSGLNEFEQILIDEQPDILHFHELSGSNGITIHHLEIAQKLNIKMFITLHLVGYVCLSGTLVENGKKLCDGKIGTFRCSSCFMRSKGLQGLTSSAVAAISCGLQRLGINTYGKPGRINTVFGVAAMANSQLDRLKKLESLCNKIIVLTPWFQEMLVMNGMPSDKLELVPQGLTVEAIPEPNSKTVSSPIKLVFLGRIHWAKGLLILLEALKHLDPASYSLDIYGPESDEAYRQQCESLINQNAPIFWKARIPVGQSTVVLAQYDLLCLPSMVTEMAPLVIEEAKAVGVPVLASNVYGNSYAITPGENGWLFELGNAKDLAFQLQNLINFPELLLKVVANEGELNSFTSIATKYHQLYQEN